MKNLTPREKQVLDLICDGDTNLFIAKALGISYETVKRHITNIMDKTGHSTRTGLASFEFSRRGAMNETERVQEVKRKTIAKLREAIAEIEDSK